MPRQLLLSSSFASRTSHGGEIRKGKRKLARPIDPKRPLHLVMRSTRARGELSLLKTKHRKPIETLLRQTAQRFQIRIYGYANVGNHLHLLIQGKDRKSIQNFLRVAAGKIALLVTQAKKGQAFGRFWDLLAFSRVVEWGRGFRTLRNYIIKNLIDVVNADLSWKEIERAMRFQSSQGPPAHSLILKY